MKKRILLAVVYLLAALLLLPAYGQRPALNSPVIRFSDSNGKPLAGGKLFSYQAGTTTPLSTFVDSTTGAVNTNPTILDSTGSATIFLGANVYKLVLQNSAGVVQWTADNIAQNAFGSGTGGDVTSVFGRTGVVTAHTGDYSCGQVTGALCSLGTIYYQTMQGNGTSAPQEPILNMISGVPGQVASVSVTAGGTLYTGTPTVAFSGGGCTTEPTASSVINGSGAVTAVTLITNGAGCTTPPSVAFSGGGGSGAAATAILAANGITCVDDAPKTSTDCTFVFSNGSSATVQTDVTGSRALGTTYQNTTTSPMYLSGWGVNGGGSGDSAITCLNGPSTASLSVWADTTTGTVSGEMVGFACFVPPGYFYELTATNLITSIGKWVEMTGFGGGGSGGSGTVSIVTAPSGSWPSWLVPTVTSATTTPNLAVAAGPIPNSALANFNISINTISCTLGGSCTIPVGSFSTVAPGTNVGALLMGSGGSLGTTGGGTIAATSVPNTAVTPGTYTNLNATVGADGRLTAASNGSGGASGISGQAAGVIPLGSTATTIGAQSHCDDGVTTGSTVTCSEQFAVHSISTPSQWAFTYNTGHSLIPGSSTTAVYGVDASGNAIGSEAGGSAARFCTATNGICSTGTGLSGMTATQVPIAATASTVTSSKPIAGSGAGLTSGPTSATATDLATFTSTTGGLVDSGVALASVCVPTGFLSQTDGTTVTWAIGGAVCANAALLFTVHSGSRTLNLTGLVGGGSYVLAVKQDATGGEGLTLGSGCVWKVGGGGAGAITPSTAANAIDVLAFTYDGTNCFANFRTNFN